ncbi:unnamed protein product [Amoebophrya sp. A25]|nr:unnamed protein product [Amoebophrya sp. A25]|eukprot:GSA25T00019664001.1
MKPKMMCLRKWILLLPARLCFVSWYCKQSAVASIDSVRGSKPRPRVSEEYRNWASKRAFQEHTRGAQDPWSSSVKTPYRSPFAPGVLLVESEQPKEDAQDQGRQTSMLELTRTLPLATIHCNEILESRPVLAPSTTHDIEFQERDEVAGEVEIESQQFDLDQRTIIASKLEKLAMVHFRIHVAEIQMSSIYDIFRVDDTGTDVRGGGMRLEFYVELDEKKYKPAAGASAGGGSRNDGIGGTRTSDPLIPGVERYLARVPVRDPYQVLSNWYATGNSIRNQYIPLELVKKDPRTKEIRWFYVRRVYEAPNKHFVVVPALQHRSSTSSCSSSTLGVAAGKAHAAHFCHEAGYRNFKGNDQSQCDAKVSPRLSNQDSWQQDIIGRGKTKGTFSEILDLRLQDAESEEKLLLAHVRRMKRTSCLAGDEHQVDTEQMKLVHASRLLQAYLGELLRQSTEFTFTGSGPRLVDFALRTQRDHMRMVKRLVMAGASLRTDVGRTKEDEDGCGSDGDHRVEDGVPAPVDSTTVRKPTSMPCSAPARQISESASEASRRSVTATSTRMFDEDPAQRVSSAPPPLMVLPPILVPAFASERQDDLLRCEESMPPPPNTSAESEDDRSKIRSPREGLHQGLCAPPPPESQERYASGAQGSSFAFLSSAFALSPPPDGRVNPTRGLQTKDQHLHDHTTAKTTPLRDLLLQFSPSPKQRRDHCYYRRTGKRSQDGRLRTYRQNPGKRTIMMKAGHTNENTCSSPTPTGEPVAVLQRECARGPLSSTSSPVDGGSLQRSSYAPSDETRSRRRSPELYSSGNAIEATSSPKSDEVISCKWGRNYEERQEQCYSPAGPSCPIIVALPQPPDAAGGSPGPFPGSLTTDSLPGTSTSSRDLPPRDIFDGILLDVSPRASVKEAAHRDGGRSKTNFTMKCGAGPSSFNRVGVVEQRAACQRQMPSRSPPPLTSLDASIARHAAPPAPPSRPKCAPQHRTLEQLRAEEGRLKQLKEDAEAAKLTELASVARGAVRQDLGEYLPVDAVIHWDSDAESRGDPVREVKITEPDLRWGVLTQIRNLAGIFELSGTSLPRHNPFKDLVDRRGEILAELKRARADIAEQEAKKQKVRSLMRQAQQHSTYLGGEEVLSSYAALATYIDHEELLASALQLPQRPSFLTTSPDQNRSPLHDINASATPTIPEKRRSVTELESMLSHIEEVMVPMVRAECANGHRKAILHLAELGLLHKLSSVPLFSQAVRGEETVTEDDEQVEKTTPTVAEDGPCEEDLFPARRRATEEQKEEIQDNLSPSPWLDMDDFSPKSEMKPSEARATLRTMSPELPTVVPSFLRREDLIVPRGAETQDGNSSYVVVDDIIEDHASTMLGAEGAQDIMASDHAHGEQEDVEDEHTCGSSSPARNQFSTRIGSERPEQTKKTRRGREKKKRKRSENIYNKDDEDSRVIEMPGRKKTVRFLARQTLWQVVIENADLEMLEAMLRGARVRSERPAFAPNLEEVPAVIYFALLWYAESGLQKLAKRFETAVQRTKAEIEITYEESDESASATTADDDSIASTTPAGFGAGPSASGSSLSGNERGSFGMTIFHGAAAAVSRGMEQAGSNGAQLQHDSAEYIPEFDASTMLDVVHSKEPSLAREAAALLQLRERLLGRERQEFRLSETRLVRAVSRAVEESVLGESQQEQGNVQQQQDAADTTMTQHGVDDGAERNSDSTSLEDLGYSADEVPGGQSVFFVRKRRSSCRTGGDDDHRGGKFPSTCSVTKRTQHVVDEETRHRRDALLLEEEVEPLWLADALKGIGNLLPDPQRDHDDQLITDLLEGRHRQLNLNESLYITSADHVDNASDSEQNASHSASEAESLRSNEQKSSEGQRSASFSTEEEDDGESALEARRRYEKERAFAMRELFENRQALRKVLENPSFRGILEGASASPQNQTTTPAASSDGDASAFPFFLGPVLDGKPPAGWPEVPVAGRIHARWQALRNPWI